MRKAPNAVEAVAHEVARAKNENIGIWAWPIYNHAKGARTARRLAKGPAVKKGRR